MCDEDTAIARSLCVLFDAEIIHYSSSCSSVETQPIWCLCGWLPNFQPIYGTCTYSVKPCCQEPFYILLFVVCGQNLRWSKPIIDVVVSAIVFFGDVEQERGLQILDLPSNHHKPCAIPLLPPSEPFASSLYDKIRTLSASVCKPAGYSRN